MPKFKGRLPNSYGTDFSYPCIVCSANHTHIIRHDGKLMRVCYDCMEILEADMDEKENR